MLIDIVRTADYGSMSKAPFSFALPLIFFLSFSLVHYLTTISQSDITVDVNLQIVHHSLFFLRHLIDHYSRIVLQGNFLLNIYRWLSKFEN